MPRRLFLIIATLLIARNFGDGWRGAHARRHRL